MYTLFLFQNAIEFARKAVKEDESDNYTEAIHLYEVAEEYFAHAIKCKWVYIKISLFLFVKRQKYNSWNRRTAPFLKAWF